MQQPRIFFALALLAAAPFAWAVPDADGNVSSTPAPDVSSDGAMKARLNYNIGYEKFEKALQLDKSTAKRSTAEAREQQQTMLEGYALSRERFRTAVAADPGLKEAWNLIGYTSRRLGDYEESLSAYDKALAIAPDYPEAIEYRAELFLLTGRLPQVKEAYGALLKASPSYAGVLKTSMQEWLAEKKPAANVSDADRSSFADWVATL
jgi:tetratricopeptide (TPR) repeat protein